MQIILEYIILVYTVGMKKQGKTLSIIALLLIVFFISIGNVNAEDVIYIGATLSLTGEYVEPARMILNSYRLWEKEVNTSGGLLGRQVELIVIDDKSRADTANKGYRHLVKEREVDLVLSPYSTPLTLAASEITEPNRYVLIACGASGEILWNRGYSYLFGMYAMARRYFIGFLDVIAREGLDTVSIIYETNTFNRDAAEGARYWAEMMGVTVVQADGFDPEENVLNDIVIKIQQIKPHSVIICSYPPAGYTFLKRLKQATFKPEALAMTITPVHPSFYEQAGSIANNVFAPSQWEPIERIPFPGTKQFIKDFSEFTGTDPSYHAGSAYAACQILEKAVESIGSMDHEKIRSYIASLDTVTVIGRFKVDETGKQVGHNPILIQWQDGKKEIVYPSHMRTANPRF